MTIVSTVDRVGGSQTIPRTRKRWRMGRAFLIGIAVAGILTLVHVATGHPLPGPSSNSSAYLAGYYIGRLMLLPGLFVVVAIFRNAFIRGK
jgi:hypothetical protein